MALADELFPQLDVVVDLAVERNDERAVLRHEWLVAMLQIDDREPRMAERELRVDDAPRIVRAAMPQQRELPPDCCLGVPGCAGVPPRVRRCRTLRSPRWRRVRRRYDQQ